MFCGDLHLCNACCARTWPERYPFFVFDEDDKPLAHLTHREKTVEVEFQFKQFFKLEKVKVNLKVWQLVTNQAYFHQAKIDDAESQPFEIVRDAIPEQMIVDEPEKAKPQKRKIIDDDRWKHCKNLLR